VIEYLFPPNNGATTMTDLSIVPPGAKPAGPRLLEGRTIRTLDDLREFCNDAVLAVICDGKNGGNPEQELEQPHDMRLLAKTLNGKRVYSLEITRW
jgi:hypothetical protein